MGRKFFFLFLLIFISSHLIAQINAPGNSYSTSTDYSTGTQDPIFCFLPTSTIQLSADIVTGATYEWTKYNTTTHAWDISAGNGSSITVTEEGGYQLTVDSASNFKNYRCWVFIPGVNGTAKVAIDNMTCEGTYVRIPELKVLTYPDINSSGYPNLYLNYDFRWYTTEPDTAVNKNEIDTNISNPTSETLLDIYYSTTLNATISGLGLAPIEADPLDIDTTYQVYAYYVQKIRTKDSISNEIVPLESAPIYLTFLALGEGNSDKSKGQDIEYTIIVDRSNNEINEPELYRILKPVAEDLPYEDPGEYTCTLTVENDYCSDTYSEAPITITDTYIRVPNVFTPNGDGINDEFKVSFRSIKDFEMIIVNRWGRPVYKSTNVYDGWNGKIGGSKAAPGVYYYVVSYEGYDGVSGKKKGFLHLITDGK